MVLVVKKSILDHEVLYGKNKKKGKKKLSTQQLNTEQK